MNLLMNLIKDEEGASMAEYALLLGLIVVAIVAVITTLGSRISTAISNASTAIPT